MVSAQGIVSERVKKRVARQPTATLANLSLKSNFGARIYNHTNLAAGALSAGAVSPIAQLRNFFAKGYTRAISTLPVPRYTLTNPSPDVAKAIKLLEDRSTVKLSEEDQAMAMLPSMRISSFCSLTSTMVS